MKRALLLWLLPGLAVSAPAAGPFCQRLPFDEESPAGLAGRYEIVGKDGKTGRPYAGTLQLTIGRGAYRLARTVGGTTLGGEAWAETCGADDILLLRVRYDRKPAALELSCYFRFDGDNYERTSCRALDGEGLESWDQIHDRLAP